MKNLYDFRSLQRSKHLRLCCFVLFGALHSFQVSAQAYNAGDVFGYVYYKTTGNTTAIETGGSSSTSIRDMGWGGNPSTTGGDVVYKGNPTMRNGSGNPLVVDVIAKVPASAAAKIIGAALGIGAAVQTASALYELCKELGFGCGGKDANGQPLITRETTSQRFCTYTPNYNCGYASDGASFLRARGCEGVSFYPPLGLWQCGAPYWTNADPQGPPTTSNGPATLQEVEDAIVRRTTGWPLTSTVHKALEDAARATGQKVPVQDPKVSGPATSPGRTTTTVDPAKNTTTTTGVTHHHTYNDNRVENRNVTSVNVTNNNTGQSETTTTTEEPAEEPSECEKNPGSLNCADLDTPEGEIPRVEKLITFNPENLGFGGGSCPSNVVQDIGGKPVTVVNWAQNCSYITSYAKPMILALATFAALMIIFVGGKPE